MKATDWLLKKGNGNSQKPFPFFAKRKPTTVLYNVV